MVDEKGIPFQSLNTSIRLIYGIKFIKKVKEILNNDYGIVENDLPILFDKAEEISSKTLKKYSDVFEGCQIICTRVTEDDKLIVRYE